MPDNPDLTWAIEDVRRRQPHLATLRDYYDGRHRLTFATEKFRNAFGDLFREFADNLCDDVVDEPVDRLQILNWTGRAGQAAQDLWAANRGDSRAGQIHLNGFREGDGYLIVWTDPEGQPRLYVQDPACMAVRYSADFPDRIDLAAKVYRDGKRYRATLYYPDRIERYASKGTGDGGSLPKADAFQPLTETETVTDPATGEDTTVITQDWQEPHDHGRVPVFHFPSGTISGYGISVLADVIPLQDALNKAVADMLVAMEFHALPQRYATGVQIERDPTTGREIDPFQQGRLWWTGAKDAELGQFDAADLSQFLDVQDGFRLEIARKGALPPHAVNLRSGGGAPSGIALLVSEGKLIKRVRDVQRDWGWIWREAMAFALTLAGTPTSADDLSVEWAPPETRDEKALLEALAIKRELGVSQRQVLLEAGYDTDQVDEFLEEADAAAEAAKAAQMAMGGGRVSGLGMGLATGLTDTLGLPPGPAGPGGSPEPALGG